MSAKSAIYKRLKASTQIVAAVNGAIYPEWRGQAVPAVVYGLRMDGQDRGFTEGILTGSWELTIGVVHESEDAANQIANLVVDHLDHADWIDGATSVLGVFLRSRDESSVAKTTSSVRLATIELVFDVEVSQTEEV